MFSKFKSALINAVSGLEAEAIGEPSTTVQSPSSSSSSSSSSTPVKYVYARPHFLNLTSEDEIQVSADHVIRPIIVPRDINLLPWSSGYAETINAGKSTRNEDQAVIHNLPLCRLVADDNKNEAIRNIPNPPLHAVYFGLFDGHAGCGASVVASNTLHTIIHEKLLMVVEHLLPAFFFNPVNGDVLIPPKSDLTFTSMCCTEQVTIDSLIIGALEAAFKEMDQQIKQDRIVYKVTGGCTALVALFILGKLFVANAGDSRAILVRNGKAQPISNDFTPETEKQRVLALAAQQPHLLGSHYTCKEFIRRPTQKDLQKKMLYRDAHMTGWTLKTISADDLKFPVICGEGKRSRVLATIGVTRGFGDHDLKAQMGNVPIKPFLSSAPEVQVFDLTNSEISDNDVLIMGTDGLWDITSNDQAAEIIRHSLQHFPAKDDKHSSFRYTMAAQDLVMNSRGKYHERAWKTSDNKVATIDDISVFVIPLEGYREEFAAWKNFVANSETTKERLHSEGDVTKKQS